MADKELEGVYLEILADECRLLGVSPRMIRYVSVFAFDGKIEVELAHPDLPAAQFRSDPTDYAMLVQMCERLKVLEGDDAFE
jgi:hypothetical protein